MKVRYDDFWILTCLRRRIELPFAAPLPLGETFGLGNCGQLNQPRSPVFEGLRQYKSSTKVLDFT
jgi:hypothetical protein